MALGDERLLAATAQPVAGGPIRVSRKEFGDAPEPGFVGMKPKAGPSRGGLGKRRMEPRRGVVALREISGPVCGDRLGENLGVVSQQGGGGMRERVDVEPVLRRRIGDDRRQRAFIGGKERIFQRMRRLIVAAFALDELAHRLLQRADPRAPGAETEGNRRRPARGGFALRLAVAKTVKAGESGRRDHEGGDADRQFEPRRDASRQHHHRVSLLV